MADKPLVKPGLPKHKPCPFFYYRKHVLAPVLNYRYFTGNLDVRFWRVQEIRKKKDTREIITLIMISKLIS